jgi:glycosyltransferase involved in cell wall biosynthesis
MEANAARQSLGLSVIIITKNEAARLGDCLASVKFADEIIVLDGCSTDGTAEIARAHGAQVHQAADWPGFGPQKNRALALATKPWVLSIDADERVTPELQAEIVRTLAQPTWDGYQIARLSEFCGKKIHHSGWWPDYVLRLFRRELGAFDDVLVHEQVLVRGRVGKLKSWFLHFPFDDLDALVTKINRYSSDAAQMMARKGRRVGVFGLITHSVWTFMRIYLLRRGFLDGRHGFVLAATAASGSFLRYSKLMFLNEANQRARASGLSHATAQSQFELLSEANEHSQPSSLIEANEHSQPSSLIEANERSQPRSLIEADKPSQPRTLTEADKPSQPKTLTEVNTQPQSTLLNISNGRLEQK